MQKDRVNKAIREYLRKSHNRMLKQYNLKHDDIRRLVVNIDFNNLDLSSITVDGKVPRGSYLDKQLSNIQKDFQAGLKKIIEKSMWEAWEGANLQNDALFMKAYNIVESDNSTLFKRDLSQWNELKNRQLFEGRTLSGRIWKLSNDYKREIKTALRIGFLNGDSAIEIAKKFHRYSLFANEKYLDIDKIPDEQIRREVARQATRRKGSLGTVFKDAKRLAGNETNITYREAEQRRWKNATHHVLGYEIKLSNAHKVIDICDFVNGRYPLWFKWNGWHPNCLCYRVPILIPYDDYINNVKRQREGKKPIIKGVIKDVPNNFKIYMRGKYEQMSNWKSKPYFMEDNDVGKILGL